MNITTGFGPNPDASRNVNIAAGIMSTVYKRLPWIMRTTTPDGRTVTTSVKIDITFGEWQRLHWYWKRGIYLPGEKCSYIEIAFRMETQKNGPMDKEKLMVCSPAANYQIDNMI